MNTTIDPNFLPEIYRIYAEKKMHLIEKRRLIPGGILLCKQMSYQYDEIITRAFNYVFNKNKNQPALAAIGGYGRNEICFESDIDILFLCKDSNNSSEIENNIKDLLNYFWDIKFDIGYSIRNYEECIEKYYTDYKSFSSILEIRFICGDTEVHSNFLDTLETFLDGEKNFHFIFSIVEEMRHRHFKYGNSVKLQEPNIKNSSGGLRDLHNLLWIFTVLEPSLLEKYNFQSNGNPENSAAKNNPVDFDGNNSVIHLLGFLKNNDIIIPNLYNQVIQAYDFLLKTRNELQLIEGTHSDLLRFNIQTKLAEGLGYSTPETEGVQLFMRDYYLNARIIYRLVDLLSNNLLDLISAKKSRTGGKIILDKDFLINNNRISLVDEDIDTFRRDMTKLFNAFLYKCNYGINFDEFIRNSIINSLEDINNDVRNNGAISSIFIKILQKDKNVAFTLDSMNELGVLGRYIPEFGKLIALYQHSEYHYYTMDEHTLMAINKIEELSDRNNYPAIVFKNIENKEVLFLAILFHDIGKIFSLKEHEYIGAEIAIMILERLGLNKYVKTVYFLIRYHLQMEKIAFRRNTEDYYTVLEFAKTVQDISKLNYLYLLTYADLSSVNLNMWTEWKSSLLFDLYCKTKDILNNSMGLLAPEEIIYNRSIKIKEEIKKILFPNVAADTIENYFDNLISTGYVFAFNANEIARHFSLVHSGNPVSTIFHKRENYTEVTVLSTDLPSILEKICGVLTANDCNIIDAKIFTGVNNIIIDSFRVINIKNNSFLEDDQCDKIQNDLLDVLNKKVDINDLLLIYYRKWKRKIKTEENNPIPTKIEFDYDKKYSIIDVFAQDRIGFLYKLTETISEIGLIIYFAKISTYGDGVVDSFYVLDKNLKKIDKNIQQEIRENIALSIKKFQEKIFDYFCCF